LSAIEEAQARLARLPAKHLLLENNLASTQFFVSGKEQSIYLLCSPSGFSRRTFDALLVEKPGAGDPWPCSYEQIGRMIDAWKKDPGIRVLIENEHVFLAEGQVNVLE
jgi:hypothetical protein